MLSRFVCISFLFFLIVACSSGDKNQKVDVINDTLKKDSIEVAAPTAPEIICDKTKIGNTVYSFRNDEFILNILEKELTCKNIDIAFNDIKKQEKISKNKYAPEMSDTTTTYKVDCDSVVYISSKENSFPLYLSMQSERIALDNGFIKVGLSKEKFIQKFHLGKGVPDVIKITELEGANEFIFLFVNNILVRIVYNNLYVE